MDFYVLEYKYSTCKISLYVALALWSILVQPVQVKGEKLLVRQPGGLVTQWQSVCTVSERPWVRVLVRQQCFTCGTLGYLLIYTSPFVPLSFLIISCCNSGNLDFVFFYYLRLPYCKHTLTDCLLFRCVVNVVLQNMLLTIAAVLCVSFFRHSLLCYHLFDVPCFIAVNRQY